MEIASFARRPTLAACIGLICLLAASAASAATIAKIVLTVPSKTLRVGHHETLKAVAKDSLGHTITGVKFTWSASRPTIAKVGSTGIVTALKAGTSTIKASAGGKSASVIITVPLPTSMTGVAAQGAALAGATITLKDKAGRTLTTTTDSNGNYSLDTTGLASPFLVRVQLDTTTFYSVSDATTASKVVNVTPLTDLIIRSWYSVQGKTVDAAFAAPTTNPAPSPTEVQIIGNVVVQVTALWLQQNGVDTTDFSFISTPFTASNTGTPDAGVDAVLAETAVDTGAGTVTITDGTTTQDSSVTYGDGSMTVDTSTSNGTDSSSSETGTVIATTTTMQDALTGITNELSAFAGTVNTKGSALKASDLTPYMDAGVLNEGLNKDQFADSTADDLRGLTISFQIQNIISLDTTNGLADVNFMLTGTEGDQSQTQSAEFFFKKQSNGTWLLYGDQLPAKINVDSEMRTNQGANATANGPDINVDIRPIKDAFTAISVNGGPFNNAALSTQGTDIQTFTPDPAFPGTTVEVDRDIFFYNTGVLANLVPAGTQITVTMTPAGGGADQVYTLNTNAFTTEAISITNLTGSTLADATVGTPLHVEWTLPKTFAVAEVKLSGNVFTDASEQCSADKPVLSNTATSGDITLPASCGSGTINGANLNVNVIGVNGEREIVIYEFQGP